MKKNKLLLGLVVIAIIAILSGFGYMKYKDMTSSKNIFRKTVSEVFKQLKSNTKSITEGEIDYSLKANINMKDNSYDSILDIINKLEINGTYKFDSKNMKMDIDLNTKYNNKALVDANLVLQDNTLYIGLKDIYDKYISIPVDEYTSNIEDSVNKEDLYQIYDSLEKAINSSLQDKYFKSEKEKELDKTILELDDKLFSEIVKNAVDILKKDDKFITSVGNLSKKDKKEVLSSLEEAYKDLTSEENSDENDEEEKVIISVYTKGVTKEFVKMEVKVDTYNLVLEKQDNVTSTSLYENDKVVATLKYTKTSDNYKIELISDEITLGLEMMIKLDENKKYEDKKIANSVLFDEISEDDYTNILVKISQNQGFIDIISAINGLTGALDF